MKLLVISEHIAPMNTVASLRWTKLGKYLNKQFDVQLDILTTKKHYSDQKKLKATFRRYDEVLAKDLKFFNRTYEIPETIFVKAIDQAFRLADSAISFIGKFSRLKPSKGTLSKNQNNSSNNSSLFNVLYGKGLEFQGLALRRSVATKMEIPWDEYDAIISSFGPSWVHGCGKAVKKGLPKIIWIADFRDPTTGIHDVSKKHKADYVKITCSDANAITATSQGTLEKLNVPQGIPVFEITNGFDPEEFTSRQRVKNDKFILSYTGTMYNEGERKSDLHPLLRALSSLIDEGLVLKEDVEVDYIGRSSALFKNQISTYKNIPWVDKGFVSREESMKLQSMSSLLIICVWNTVNAQGVIAAKLYEYFCSGAPLVGICSGNMAGSKTKEMIVGSNMGVCYEEACKEGDYVLLKQFLKNKYDEWKQQGMTSCQQNNNYISQYGYDELARRYYEILQSLKSL